MTLIICPKTTEKVIKAFSRAFELHKIPANKGKFWHGNFNDYLYEGLDGKVRALFTGYSGAVAGQAILEYYDRYRLDDKKLEIYSIGSVYAFKDSNMELGDLVYARDTFSLDSFEQAIYENARIKGINNIGKPDSILMKNIIETANFERILLKPAKVYCKISPGICPEFKRASELMDEAMWWKVSLNPIGKDGFDSGEYESAAVLATSKLLGIPAVALFDVKDKRYSEKEYKIADAEQKRRSLETLLNLVKKSILD